jgi:hypothetical protein
MNPTKEKVTTRGGARPGAGRPKGQPTKVIAFTVPKDKALHLKLKIKTLIQDETSTQSTDR